MGKSIEFKIYGRDNEITGFLESVENLSYSYKPVEMAFDSAIDSAKVIELLLEFSSNVAISIFSAWLYDKLKKDKNNIVVINENKISGENITVVQIINMIDRK